MNSKLQDEILTSIANQMQKEFDDSIMSNILIETGWTPVEFYFKSNKHAVDTNEWLSQNCLDQWRRLGIFYLFENTKDAEWFILRWV